MKKALILIFLTIAAAAHSQSLFDDFTRVTSTEYDSVNKVQIITTTGKSAFLAGNVDIQFQPMRQIPIVPLTTTVAGGSISAVTDQVFGSATYHFSSGVWWNLGPSQYRLPSGVVLPASSVVLLSEDAIPAVQLETSGSHTFTTYISSLSGAPTPGNLIIQTFDSASGGWVVHSVTPVASFQSLPFSYNSPGYKVRWLLQRTGSAPAVATITINVS
ncbi:MAG TPA: hypothetical protein VGL56_20120 [Fimbriimonadaceae bacterium]|jgi:hypothetical protein